MSFRRLGSKDPNATVPYQFDWRAYFTALGDTLDSASVVVVDATSTTEITDSDLVIEGQTQTSDGVVTAWLSGGTPGQDYNLQCTVFGTNTVPMQTRDQVTVVIPLKQL